MDNKCHRWQEVVDCLAGGSSLSCWICATIFHLSCRSCDVTSSPFRGTREGSPNEACNTLLLILSFEFSPLRITPADAALMCVPNYVHVVWVIPGKAHASWASHEEYLACVSACSFSIRLRWLWKRSALSCVHLCSVCTARQVSPCVS